MLPQSTADQIKWPLGAPYGALDMEGEDRVEPIEHVEPVKAMGFHRLPAVQTVQPRLPEAPQKDDAGAKGGTKKVGPVRTKRNREVDLSWCK